jgi:predicted transcriptional regulator
MQKIMDKMKELQEQIADAKHSKAQAEGKYNAIMDNLKKEHNISTLEEAEKEATKIKKNLDKFEVQIKEEFENLQKEFEF